METRGGFGAHGAALLLAAIDTAEPTPAAHVRAVLAHCRRRGQSFDTAWGTAMRSLPRRGGEADAWRPVLRATRDSYRAAYEHTGQLAA
ncbi:hypothetical protein [Mycobacterium sp.]|uniref:hypothetical protein n=1 Tax=Mycobacterium sp. TaxID=1785 RepID=UPI002614A484|nr:hypothetical protein [Mycobacterium sp.]